MISVYLPHAGYPHDHLIQMQTCDSLHCTLESARRLNKACVVGSDFKTQLHVGQRTELLMQTAHMFRMVIENAQQEHDTWTFCSCAPTSVRAAASTGWSRRWWETLYVAVQLAVATWTVFLARRAQTVSLCGPRPTRPALHMAAGEIRRSSGFRELTTVPCGHKNPLKNSMGVKRRLIFVCCNADLNVMHGGAVDLLDLGSHHRAVRAT